ERRRAPYDARGRDGQALFERGCRRGRRGWCADSWWIWLRQGLPGGEVLSRRQADDHRRGHERDPAAGDRAAAVNGVGSHLMRTAGRDRLIATVLFTVPLPFVASFLPGSR